MDGFDLSPYTLPTVDFVGGATQDLAFHVYAYHGNKPFHLSECTCNFSIINYMNRFGTPIISKSMKVICDDDGVDNILTVSISPAETVGMSGKYIYQISIRDIAGDVEIPKQGLFYISNNIDKAFISG